MDELDELQILFGAFYKDNVSFAEYARQELEYKQDILKKHGDRELECRVELLKAALANVRG